MKQPQCEFQSPIQYVTFGQMTVDKCQSCKRQADIKNRYFTDTGFLNLDQTSNS